MICKYKEITKYINRAKKLLDEGVDWEAIEKQIHKVRHLDFKEFVHLTFLAFGKNAKRFHKNI